MKKILFLFLLCSPIIVVAQQYNPGKETLSWLSTKTILSDTVYAIDCEIVSNPASGKISVLKNGREKFFTIKRMEGGWVNTTIPGKITYYVKLEEQDAVICFERTADDVFVSISIGSQPARKIIIDQILNR